MKQTKLYAILELLSKDEWKSLCKYVIMESSISSDTYTLFQYMNSTIKQKSEAVVKKDIKTHLFPKITEKSFLNICSRLFIIVEGWLVWSEVKKNKNKCAVHLVKIYNRRGVFNLADQKYKRIHTKLIQEKTCNLETNALLNELYHYHYFSENPVKKKKPELLIDLVNAHNLGYEERAILYLTQMTHRVKYNLYDYSDAISTLNSTLPPISESSTSIIINEIYNLVKNQEIKSLEFIFKSLRDGKITPGSDLEVFATLFGIASSQTLWNKNISKDPKFVLSFYEFGLSSGVLLNLGKLSTYRFVHITTILSKTQPAESCYQFINKWNKLLEKKDRKSSTALCIAKIKLEEKKYNEVIYLLRDHTFSSVLTQIEALTIEVMAMYEEREWNLLSGRIHNFKRKLRSAKRKTSSNIIVGQQNFLKVVEKLVSSNYKKVELDLTKYKFLNHRIWLESHLKSKGILK